MARSPFSFFRGSTCLFYADLTGGFADDSYLNEESSRTWIHGDLHAQNFGTYMNAAGRLVFGVNDFDESYLGPYIWDLKRFVTSLALIGYEKVMSDNEINEMIGVFVRSYLTELRTTAAASEEPIHLGNATGPLLAVLRRARSHTRINRLSMHTVVEDGERRFARGDGVYEVIGTDRTRVLAAFERYERTLVPSYQVRPPLAKNVKDLMMIKGMGVGSIGLPSYNFLLEGGSEALDNDVIVYMKQAQVPALARYVDHDGELFEHHGHRTVLARRALQPHTDPWLGYTDIDGIGMMVTEDSPYEEDLDWTTVTGLADITALLASLGTCVARMHAIPESRSGHPIIGFPTGPAIESAIGDDDRGFLGHLTDFAHAYANQVRIDHLIFTDQFRNNTL